MLCWFRGENAAFKFIKAIFREYEYCKKVTKRHSNKHLTINEEEEEQFQSINTCWICEEVIDDEKVRDHGHINEKFLRHSSLEL